MQRNRRNGRNRRRYRGRIGMRKRPFHWGGFLVIAGAVLFIAGLVIGAIFLFSGKNEEEPPEVPNTPQTMQALLAAENASGIPGFTQVSGDVQLKQEGLQVQMVGRYSGPFLEDGTDTPIANCAAIVVENASEQMIEHMQIKLLVGGKEAVFELTMLPAGKKALVLDHNATTYQEGMHWAYVSEEISYAESAGLLENVYTFQDVLQLETQDGIIAATNLTDTDLTNVHVYYKYWADGIYLGGITYRCPFKSIAADAKEFDVCRHYLKNNSQIVYITMD